MNYTWDDNSLQGNGSTTDVMNVICYSEDLKAFEMNEGVATRPDGAGQITLPNYLEEWMFMSGSISTMSCKRQHAAVPIWVSLP